MCLNIFAVPINVDKKVYGPISIATTSDTTFTQKMLKLNDNSIFGNYSDALPIYSVDVKGSKKKYIALTFDSSWSDQQTIPLLNMLDKYNAKATFFLTAFYVWANKESVREMLRRGHEIGNHSNTHPRFGEQKEKRIIQEIERCNIAIKEVTGVDACLFRFPYGNYNDLSMKLLKERGFYPIQWTHDSLDWKNEGVDAIIRKLGSEDSYHPGNIILFHNGADFTVEALDTVLKITKQKGLRCVRVSDLIYEKDFYVDSRGRQIQRFTNENRIATSTDLYEENH